MLKALKSIFTGSAVKSLENIASEWIQTDLETAESKTLMIRAMDPNGKMRRDISRNILRLYAFYIITMTILIILEFFGLGNQEAAEIATDKLTALFLPITGFVTTIITSSFGVNFYNVKKGK